MCTTRSSACISRRSLAAVGRLLEGKVARRAYRRHLCVAVSQSTADAMSARLALDRACPHHPQRAEPLPDASGSERPVARRRWPACGRHVSWVGRMVAHKRAERCSTWRARLRPAGVTIDVIGRGPGSESLAARMRERGLAGAVRLRGYLPEEAKRAAVAVSVLHLNTSQGEGWGLCVLEAAQLGVPTVAYDVDGLRDAVRPGETGWLVRAGQRIEDVTRARWPSSPTLPAATRSPGPAAVGGRFDWDRSAAELANLVGAAARPDCGTRPAGHPLARAAGLANRR